MPISPSIALLPDPVLGRILHYLPLPALFAASLTTRRWRNLIYHAGPLSQSLLKPHLTLLRARFGDTVVPHKLPIPTVRKLISLYAREELFCHFTSVETYDFSALSKPWTDAASAHLPVERRRWAGCSTLFALATRGKTVYLYDTTTTPLHLLCAVRTPRRAISIAVNDGFLCILDRAELHLYQLLARTTPHFLLRHLHSLPVPVASPLSLALTSSPHTAPLAAIQGTTDLALLHPSHALDLRRRSTLSLPPRTPKSPRTRTPHLLLTPAPPPSRLAFSLHDRQLLTHTHYLGAAWSAASPRELARRRRHNLKPGQDPGGPTTPDALFRHYRGISGAATPAACPRWTAKSLDTADMDVCDPVHVHDSFYIVTETDTGVVRVVSVAPFENRGVLGVRDAARACPYAVRPGGAGGAGGYLVFSPGEGRLKMLGLREVVGLLEAGGEVGWEIVTRARDVYIGRGEIGGIWCGKRGVGLLVGAKVVVVRGWSVGAGGEWRVGRGGRVQGGKGAGKENGRPGGPGKRGACEIM